MDRASRIATIGGAIGTAFGVVIGLMQWQCPKVPLQVTVRESAPPTHSVASEAAIEGPGIPEAEEDNRSIGNVGPDAGPATAEVSSVEKGVGPVAVGPSYDKESGSGEARSPKYVNPAGIGRWPQVLAVDSSNRVDLTTASKIAKPLDARTDLFLGSFVNDRLFDRALAGEVTILQNLGLAGHSGLVLLIAVQTMESSSSDIAPGLQRAEVLLTSREIHPTRNFYSAAHSSRGVGAGFSQAAARERALAQATERLLAQIED